MIFTWTVPYASTFHNPPIEALNKALSKINGTAQIEEKNGRCYLSIELSEESLAVGRPRAEVTKDLTIGEIQHARFLGTPMEEIAKSMGISKRTLYRRWNAVVNHGYPADLPFSQWP